MIHKLFFLFLIIFPIVCFSQKTTSKGEDYIKQIEGKLDKAKISIDKTLNTPEGKLSAENWYLKGYIYTELAKSEVWRSQFPNIDKDALAAIQKSKELDKENKYAPECINVMYDLGSFFYNNGINAYNAALPSMNIDGFKKALENFDLFFASLKTLGSDDKIITNLLDNAKINRNAVVFYTAFCAQKTGDNAKALDYYGQIIQPEMTDEKAKSLAVPLAYIYYPELLQAMNEPAKALNIIKKGARLYPENIDIIMAAIDFHKKAGQIDEMSEFLEKAIIASPNNPKMLVVLAGAYTTISREYDKKGYKSTSMEYRTKALSAYEKALKANPTEKQLLFNINYNMGILYYNPGVQAYKQGDEAGRVEAESLFRKATEYLEKALELDAKNKNSINMLMKCYQTLNNSKRVEELEKMLY